MSKLTCGLFQMSLKVDSSASVEDIRQGMIAAHLPLIESAAKRRRARRLLHFTCCTYSNGICIVRNLY